MAMSWLSLCPSLDFGPFVLCHPHSSMGSCKRVMTMIKRTPSSIVRFDCRLNSIQFHWRPWKNQPTTTTTTATKRKLIKFRQTRQHTGTHQLTPIRQAGWFGIWLFGHILGSRHWELVGHSQWHWLNCRHFPAISRKNKANPTIRLSPSRSQRQQQQQRVSDCIGPQVHHQTTILLQ